MAPTLQDRPDVAVFGEIGVIEHLIRQSVQHHLPSGMTFAHFELLQHFIRNGDEKQKEEYEDSWYVSASEKADRPPTVLNKDRSAIRTDNGVVYAGCYVDVLIRPWVQNNSHGKKINANLLAVQFRRDGEAFADDTRPDPTEVFEDLSDSDFDDASDNGGDPFAD